MKVKNRNKAAFNILNLIHLEKSIKNQNNISFPMGMGKLKSSLKSYALFLNQKNPIKNLPPKNSNKKNIITKNKTKNLNLNSMKFTDLIKSNKVISKKNMNKSNNNNKIKNINQINPKYNMKLNSSNSIHKKRKSHSVHEQRKKEINDIYSKKQIKEDKENKEKEINCLKLSSNNTGSTSINSSNTKNFNSKNNKNKTKSTLGALTMNIEEIKKENKKLKNKIEIINKENKNLNVKINKLRDKNLELRNILYSLKKERDDYSQSISQSLKLLKLLKKNGLDLSEIMNQLSNSSSDDEEEGNNNEDDNYKIISDEKKTHMDYFSEKYKNCEKDDDNDSDYTDISFGRLECHEEFSLKKIPKELTYIPKLKINNINKDNKNNI